MSEQIPLRKLATFDLVFQFSWVKFINIDRIKERPFLETRYSFVPKRTPNSYGYVSIPWSNFHGRQIFYDFYKNSGKPPVFHTRYSIGFPPGYMFRELPFLQSSVQTSSISIQA